MKYAFKTFNILVNKSDFDYDLNYFLLHVFVDFVVRLLVVAVVFIEKKIQQEDVYSNFSFEIFQK